MTRPTHDAAVLMPPVPEHGPQLFATGAVADPLAGHVMQLRLHAARHRDAATELLALAERADAAADRLTARRHAMDVFADHPQALTLVACIAEDWPGSGQQLVEIVRAALTVDRP